MLWLTCRSGLLACRFFLGLCEGGLLGGMILYLSMYSLTPGEATGLASNNNLVGFTGVTIYCFEWAFSIVLLP